MRDYLRQRKRLLDYASSHIQHMQKALMQMNLQLHHVVSDITGATGMRIIRAVLGGERDPSVLAGLRDQRVKASEETVHQALVGNDREEHVFALLQAVELYDAYQAKVAACDVRIEAALKELETASPPPMAALLRLAAVTVGRTETALGAFYRRLAGRVGKAKAVTATARKTAVLFYNTLRHGMDYTDRRAVMGRLVLVGAADLRLVAAGGRDARLEVVAGDLPRHPAEAGERADVAADPIGQRLRPPRLRMV